MFWDPFREALYVLSAELIKRFKMRKPDDPASLLNNPLLGNVYAIVMEMPFLGNLELMHSILPNFYLSVKFLPLSCQVGVCWCEAGCLCVWGWTFFCVGLDVCVCGIGRLFVCGWVLVCFGLCVCLCEIGCLLVWGWVFV